MISKDAYCYIVHIRMQIYMDIKYMIDLFSHIISLLIFLGELKVYLQVYKPSVIVEQIVCADVQSQIT